MYTMSKDISPFPASEASSSSTSCSSRVNSDVVLRRAVLATTNFLLECACPPGFVAIRNEETGKR